MAPHRRLFLLAVAVFVLVAPTAGPARADGTVDPKAAWAVANAALRDAAQANAADNNALRGADAALAAARAHESATAATLAAAIAQAAATQHTVSVDDVAYQAAVAATSRAATAASVAGQVTAAAEATAATARRAASRAHTRYLTALHAWTSANAHWVAVQRAHPPAHIWMPAYRAAHAAHLHWLAAGHADRVAQSALHAATSRAGRAHTASTAAVHTLNVARARRSAAAAAATAAAAAAARAQAAIAPARAAHNAALPAIPAAENVRVAAQATADASAGSLAAAAAAATGAAAQVPVTPDCPPADVYSGASAAPVMSRSGTVITRYTKAGRAPMWVTEVNLAGPGVRSRTGPIGGPQIASRTQQATQLAGTGAIAAVNGDFFSVTSDNSPLGPVVERGAHAVKGTAKPQTAVILQTNGLAATGNLWLDISLRHGSSTVRADALNTHTLPIDGIAVFTARWGTANRSVVAPPPVSEYIVTAAGIVSAVHAAMTTATLPAGGMVLLAQGAGRTSLTRAGIVKGATVRLATAVHSDAPAAVDTAIGVGRSLLRDGVDQYPMCEQDTAYARTIVGVRPGGLTMVIASVQARTDTVPPASGGLSTRDAQGVARGLGLYSASMFDGGPSTILTAALTPGRYTQLTRSAGSVSPIANSYAIWPG